MELTRQLALVAVVFYLICCGYLGYKNRDWMEIGIAVFCILCGVAAVFWWPG